jgi:hypothetical protein
VMTAQRHPCRICRKYYCAATDRVCVRCEHSEKTIELQRAIERFEGISEPVVYLLVTLFSGARVDATRNMLTAANSVHLDDLCEQLRDTGALSEHLICATREDLQKRFEAKLMEATKTVTKSAQEQWQDATPTT